MNILIVGEFSAFAKHLKNGFLQLGHDVCVIQDGDGFKKITPAYGDIVYRNKNFELFGIEIPKSLSLAAFFLNRNLEAKIVKRFNGKIDLVVIVNYRFLSLNWHTIGLRLPFIMGLLDKGAKLIVSACGGDPAFRSTYPDLMKIWGMNSKQDLNDKRFLFLLDQSNVIIPTIYSYYYSMRSFCERLGKYENKVHKPIPLPMTVDKDCQISSCANRKIVVFHGVIRPKEKGTPYIKEAMDRLLKKYPDKVQCICKGGMPYDEYVKVFEDVDILIDQTYQNGWGVNAAIGAMKGKCVLAPCGKENGDLMGIPDIPFVQIGPDSNQIYEVLEDLILNPSKIDDIKLRSRRFIENYCDSKLVAKQYVDAVESAC